VLRTEEEVLLKNSLNLVAEPEVAAVAALEARPRQLLIAVRIAVPRVPVQSLWTMVRLLSLETAVEIVAVFSASTSTEMDSLE